MQNEVRRVLFKIVKKLRIFKMFSIKQHFSNTIFNPYQFLDMWVVDWIVQFTNCFFILQLNCDFFKICYLKKKIFEIFNYLCRRNNDIFIKYDYSKMKNYKNKQCYFDITSVKYQNSTFIYLFKYYIYSDPKDFIIEWNACRIKYKISKKTNNIFKCIMLKNENTFNMRKNVFVLHYSLAMVHLKDNSPLLIKMFMKIRNDSVINPV